MPSRPLFPSATVVASSASTTSSAPLGADFKPLMSTAGSSIGPIKPTFPAYSNDSSSTPTSTASDSKVAMIAVTGASSKIIHPPEDLSLVNVDFFSCSLKTSDFKLFTLLTAL